MSYGGPPQGGYYGGPPPGQYQQQPPYPAQSGPYPAHNPYPPQGGYQQGPPPPGPHGHHHPPPHQGHGHTPPPPQQAFGFPPPLPSPGYDPHAPLVPGDASHDADALRAAMKGFGTNETQLIRILSKPDPNQMRLLVHTYNTRLSRNLEKDIKSETSGHFEDGLLALVRGPLATDVHLLHRAIRGLGTKESYLNDILLCRSNADIRAIKDLYQRTHNRSLISDVKGDLSFKTEELFTMALAATRAEESAPFDPAGIERDVHDFYAATAGRAGTDQLTVCRILTSRSNGQIRAIAQQYAARHHNPLSTVIAREFSGHMKDALLLIVGRAEDRAMTDAVQLEETMKGVGTKDELLVQRVIRVHWDREACDQVKRAYRYKYQKDLTSRIRGEVSGHVESLLVACLE